MENTEPQEYKCKTHDPKYFLNYYYAHLAIKIPCPHCNKSVSRSKMPRHIRTTQSCLLLRAQKELRKLKGEPETPEPETAKEEPVEEPPEYPPSDVKCMVDAETARRHIAKSIKWNDPKKSISLVFFLNDAIISDIS